MRSPGKLGWPAASRDRLVHVPVHVQRAGRVRGVSVSARATAGSPGWWLRGRANSWMGRGRASNWSAGAALVACCAAWCTSEFCSKQSSSSSSSTSSFSSSFLSSSLPFSFPHTRLYAQAATPSAQQTAHPAKERTDVKPLKPDCSGVWDLDLDSSTSIDELMVALGTPSYMLSVLGWGSTCIYLDHEVDQDIIKEKLVKAGLYRKSLTVYLDNREVVEYHQFTGSRMLGRTTWQPCSPTGLAESQLCYVTEIVFEQQRLKQVVERQLADGGQTLVVLHEVVPVEETADGWRETKPRNSKTGAMEGEEQNLHSIRVYRKRKS
eukprot:g4240.t1